MTSIAKRLELSMAWAKIPWISKTGDAYVMLHLHPVAAQLLLNGTQVDIGWAKLDARPDGSFDLVTQPANAEAQQGPKVHEVHARDQKFVQKVMFAAYDLLQAVDSSDRALLPDAVVASGRRFHRALKKARKEMESGEAQSKS